jgi:hypothetical protein
MSSDPSMPAQAATTPQQQPQGTPIQQNAPTPASVAGGSGGDQLVCQWQSCGERLPSAEQLYVSLTSEGIRAVLSCGAIAISCTAYTFRLHYRIIHSVH